jgi:hypothetical protein
MRMARDVVMEEDDGCIYEGGILFSFAGVDGINLDKIRAYRRLIYTNAQAYWKLQRILQLYI